MEYKNLPPYAQQQIDRILRSSRAFARAYVDDIVVFSRSLQEHLTHLETVFQQLSDANITLKGSKSFLGYPSITLLDQKVDSLGLSTTEEKLAAIRNIQFPTTLKELEHYLGLTGYHRHYIPYYAQLTEPLQKLKTSRLKEAPRGGHARLHFTKSNRIEPTAELLEAFDALQAAFAKPTMLVHFNLSRPLFINLDALKKYGFGVIMYHVKGDPTLGEIKRTQVKPVLYLSKLLSTAEQNYWPTELEVAGLV